MTFKLFALTAASDTEKEIEIIRESLYARWGLASSLALPVLIPLLSTPANITLLRTERLKEIAIPASSPCTAGDFVDKEGCLLLEVRSSGFIPELRESIKRLLPQFEMPKFREAFPLCDGFFLAFREDLSGFKEVISSLGPPPGLHFRPEAISVIEIESLKSASAWWEGLEWEETLKLTFKKAKPGREDSVGRPPPGPELPPK